MFLLFVNLYLGLLTGTWQNLGYSDYANGLESSLNAMGELATSIFGNVSMSDFGTKFFTFSQFANYVPNFQILLAFILATITSIGIVVIAVKGVKRAFGIFFMGIRR